MNRPHRSHGYNVVTVQRRVCECSDTPWLLSDTATENRGEEKQTYSSSYALPPDRTGTTIIHPPSPGVYTHGAALVLSCWTKVICNYSLLYRDKRAFNTDLRSANHSECKITTSIYQTFRLHMMQNAAFQIFRECVCWEGRVLLCEIPFCMKSTVKVLKVRLSCCFNCCPLFATISETAVSLNRCYSASDGRMQFGSRPG